MIVRLGAVAVLAVAGAALCGCSAETESPHAGAAPLRAAAMATATAPVRAAYFYQYMDVDHLDMLARAGFNRALIKWIVDSLETRGSKLHRWVKRGRDLGVEVTPVWALQARQRLHALPTTRRYTWGNNVVESDIGCPLDPLFWRSALLDRIDEHIAIEPTLRRLAVDLEIYFGGPGHYDAGPCRCRRCLHEFDARTGLGAQAQSMKITAYQTARLERILTELLDEIARRHPRLELGFFDLGFDSFVHEALSRALMATGVPTVNYSEKTYSRSVAALPKVLESMASYGLDAPLVGGLWLKRFAPEALTEAARSLSAEADGYFIFTTYSLWKDFDELAGPYTLEDSQARYWAALRLANRE